MVKNGVFKKIAALTAAIAMVLSFAVCAGAVHVETTTQYVEGDTTKVNVIANVSGLGDAAYVTYYATNADGVVYADQEDVVDSAATFDYVTAATNIENSTVKVGYTAGTSAEDAAIDGYSVAVVDGTAVVIPTLPAAQTVVVPYAVEYGYEVTGVTATAGATAALVTYDATTITVALSDITGDVTLTVATAALPNLSATGSHVNSAAKVSDGADNDWVGDIDTNEEITGADKDAYRAAEGDRKLTVLAQVAGSTEYGVIITKDTLEAGVEVAALPEAGVYAAKGANGEGYFAVQLIDTGADTAEEALIQSGVAYNTYVYYKTLDGYMIVAGDVVTAE